MDNASNALIMAAEILIAILVLSLIVTVNVLFGSFSRSVNDQIAKNRDTAFNAHFYNYLNRADISASEVASIINFSKITNDENGYIRIKPDDTSTNAKAPYYINVYINGKSFFWDFGNPDGSKIYVNDNVYNNSAQFKDAVNSFISDYKQYAFCCNVKKIIMPASGENKVKLECYSDSDDTEVSIVDKKHPNVKQDGNIRVVRICFKTVNPVTEYDITNSNDYTFVIQ